MSPPEDLMRMGLRLVGRLDAGDPEAIKAFYEKLSASTGLEVSRVRGIMERETALYGLLDHTRTIALMLGDGIVPSNSGFST
jgi:alanyl-tRNA synthetase